STAGWVILSRERPADLIGALDQDFDLVSRLNEQRDREWTWADVLAHAMAPLQRASSSIRQGRNLEDQVEEVIQRVGLPFVARTRFQGRAGDSAPADFSIPAGGEDALVAVGVKGFDSTGSKLTDARREIEEMVKVKTSNQFIFAIVDGQGWIRRQNDLRQIHALWVRREIDGLFNQHSLPEFEISLRAAGRRVDLLP
ncbi:MAG TPA: DpnII family type II restriction endonuclease, partial [Solirubrobacterales bacterium]|nr:DpnII family type II restriction endonuclease [Solirubrobacterales bacterium]